jgi:hypothetical protein
MLPVCIRQIGSHHRARMVHPRVDSEYIRAFGQFLLFNETKIGWSRGQANAIRVYLSKYQRF